ncbi:MAG: DUF5606 domain-containing protein [Candidatus Aphodosoma sp.]
MLKSILSISGKPGLFKLVSHSKNMLVVESLTDGKRFPSHQRDRVISLGDIAMYTETAEVPLHEVLSKLKELENGAVCAVDPKSSPDTLRDFFAKVLPDFDRDRVHPSDIKKLIQWYNLLITSGNDDFSDPQATDTDTEGKE